MDIFIVLTFLIATISSILSGMASVGGAVIMSPWWLIMGLSPAQSVASAAFMDIGRAATSLQVMKRGGITTSRSMVVVFSSVAAIAALAASFILPHLDPTRFKYVLATLTLLSLPMLFSKHQRFVPGERSRRSKLAGYVIISLLLLLGSILFSSAFSILIAALMPFFFGTSVLQSSAVRRTVGLVQIIVVCIAMFHFIAWPYALAGFGGGSMGSYIGTKIAVKKGEVFAKYALAAGAFACSIALFL